MYGLQEERMQMMVESTDSTFLSQSEKSWIRHGSNHSSDRRRELLQRAYNLLTLSEISAVTYRNDQNGFALFVRRNERGRRCCCENRHCGQFIWSNHGLTSKRLQDFIRLCNIVKHWTAPHQSTTVYVH